MNRETKPINVGIIGNPKAPSLFEAIQKAQRDLLNSGIKPNAEGFYDPDELAKVLGLDPVSMKETADELERAIDELLERPNRRIPSNEETSSEKPQSDVDKFFQQLDFGGDLKRIFNKTRTKVPDNLKETASKLTQNVSDADLLKTMSDLASKFNIDFFAPTIEDSKNLSKESIDETFSKRMNEIRKDQVSKYDSAIKEIARDLVVGVEYQVRHETRPYEEINNTSLKYTGRVDILKWTSVHGTRRSTIREDVINELKQTYGFKLPNVELDTTSGQDIVFTYTPIYTN